MSKNKKGRNMKIVDGMSKNKKRSIKIVDGMSKNNKRRNMKTV